MKRSAPLARRTQLARTGGLERRVALRSSGPRRYWDDALLKVRTEGRCRGCGVGGRLDTAHLIGRRYDRSCHAYDRADLGDEDVLYVHPDSVVALCRSCHEDYDGRRLSLEGRLTQAEEAWCVRRIGLERTLRRLRGGYAEDLRGLPPLA